MLQQIIKSVILTLVISSLVSIPFYDTYWKAFSIITGIQVFGAWIINTVLESYNKMQESKAYNESLEILARNIVNIPCNSCKNIMSVPVFLNQENIIECEKCNSETKLDVIITPVSITKMIDNNVVMSKIFDEVAATASEDS